jgi:hypothetical protein
MATDFAGGLGCRRRRFRPAARRLAGGGRAGSTRPGFRHLRRRAQDAAGGTQPHPLQAEEENVFLFHGRPGDVNSRLLRLQHGLLENLQRHRRGERCGGGRFRSTPPAAPAEGARSARRNGIHACCHVRASTSSIVLVRTPRFATRLPPGRSAARPPGGPPPRRRRPGRPPGRLPWEILAYWHTGRPSEGSSSSSETPSWHAGILAYWHTGIRAVRPEISSRSRSPPEGILAYWHTGSPSGEPPSVPEVFPGDAGILAYRHTGRPSGGSSSSPEASSWDAGILAYWHAGRSPRGASPTMPANLTSVRVASSWIAGSSSGRSLPRSPLGPIWLDI